MSQINRTSLIIGAVVGLILGLLLGMLLFWGPFKVQWEDARPYDLAPDARAEYVGLVADSFKLNKDPNQAKAYFRSWRAEELDAAFKDAILKYEAEAQPARVQAVRDLAMVQGVSLTGPAVEPGEEPPAVTSFWQRIRPFCLGFFVFLLVLVLGWIGLRQAMKRRGAPRAARPVPPPEPVVSPGVEWKGTGQPPLGHFITTYQLGEDTYDESFSIETPMGEFLGECGVGISETVGAGDPDKVTAFEVWLFDKSDIRTVTKVLMSEHAFQDGAIRAKLASKGEAVVALPGSPFTLETSSLQVTVGVTELVYGDGDLPKSFFSKLTIELVATAK